jgi:glycine/D-amino acid oxidase-like deaminating enzyme
MSHTSGARYWADRTADNRRRSFPRLKGQHTADIVVIGGGLTGAAAAYTLAHAGAKVMLLEAERLAGGQTAGGIGAIVPEIDPQYRDVEDMRGRKIARPAWELVRHSAPEFAAALKRLRIKCDLDATETVVNAPNGEAVPQLKREHTARKDAGLASAWGAGVSVRRDLGTDSDGALRLHGGSTYDAVRAALGLASAAADKGAAIYEGTRVEKTKFTRKYADVIIDASTKIRTTGIIVATGEPGVNLFSPIAAAPCTGCAGSRRIARCSPAPRSRSSFRATAIARSCSARASSCTNSRFAIPSSPAFSPPGPGPRLS